MREPTEGRRQRKKSCVIFTSAGCPPYRDAVQHFRIHFSLPVQQTGSVLEYQEAFEKVLVHVSNVNEAHLQSLFHAGLKPHLQHDVMLHKPDSLSASFALAREFELKHQAWAATVSHRPSLPRDGGIPMPYVPPSPGPLLPMHGQKLSPGPKVSPTPPVRRLTFAEKKERYAKGLFYNCDEKWVKGHRCGRFLLLIEDDEESEDVVHGPDVVLGFQWLRLLGKALYGRPSPDLIPYNRGSSKVPAVDDILAERDGLLRRLRSNLQAAQTRMKLLADRHRREVEFAVGDWVLLRIQPYKQHSVARRSSQKLALRFYGPFEVVERVGPVAYRLKLPKSARIHPVFHVSVLRPFVGQGSANDVLPLPTDLVDRRAPSQPKRIHASRWVLRHGVRVEQYFVERRHLG
ncbi:unnamed protein product [Cuscuta campestris]|uniref:Tf2-1-like SH3-like domain-containing protein n=1 Tax=Cuscuta campestris TaxID=132261 RepID=A0A484NNM5_9ASTE|nr:unnamed protein product [Cuscuta campestris]